MKHPHPCAIHAARPSSASRGGYSLIEVLVALFLMSVGVLGVAPLFLWSMEQNATGADLGRAGARANARLELLRATPFVDLAVGGDLDNSVAGYFDETDPKVTVRWEVVDGGGPNGTRTIRVRAIPVRHPAVPQRAVELTMLRAR